MTTPWSTVGYLVMKRTYARRLDEADKNSETEEWSDVVWRVIRACRDQLNVGFTQDEELRLFDYMMNLKGTVAGRFLWQLGTSTVDRLGLPSLQNCAFTTIDHPIRPFTWAFDMLCLGSGVGYNLQREFVYKLPPVKEDFKAPERVDHAGADFIVPDSREGWVKLIHLMLDSAFYQNEIHPGFTYSTQVIRGKGTPIKGFGGLASGPEDLCEGIADISNVLSNRAGKQLRPIDCLDIMNILGRVVVSGNVRRSAQVAIGDCDDIQYLNAKRWSDGNIPNWRAFSNNSVVCNDIKLLPQAFWDTYDGKSEPYGLINLKLSKATGRIGDTQYKDPKVRGFNPCLSGESLVETSIGQKTMKELSELSSTNGILIKSYDEKSGEVVWKPLLKAFMTKKMATLIKLKVRSKTGELVSLKLTPDHQVFTKNRGYVEAAELRKEDELVFVEQDLDYYLENFEATENEDVFDLTVEETHCFFANGILVHNCCEQGLADFETCCLSEIFLPNIESKEEFLDIATLLYRINKHSLSLPCHHKETEKIVHENMRMGIGITGILQSPEKLEWCDYVYTKLREFDIEYSKSHGWPVSIKLSTTKPSGSLSLLPGVTPGIHPAYAQYMIRRIRIASNHPLVETCKAHGYPVEYQINFDGSKDFGTVVVEFPFSYPDGTIFAKEMTAIDQLEWVKKVQTVWSDNAVSCTVYYKPEELEEIQGWLAKNYNKNCKSLSFLLHSDHGFIQAPFEEITKEEYDRRVAGTKVITSIATADFDELDECAGGACPVR